MEIKGPDLVVEKNYSSVDPFLSLSVPFTCELFCSCWIPIGEGVAVYRSIQHWKAVRKAPELRLLWATPQNMNFLTSSSKDIPELTPAFPIQPPTPYSPNSGTGFLISPIHHSSLRDPSLFYGERAFNLFAIRQQNW